MPATNPFTDPGANLEAIDGSPVVFAPAAHNLGVQDPRPGAIAGQREFFESAITSHLGAVMNPGQTSTNAAGTSENVAVHIAMLVAAAMVGIYVLRASGFKFVVGVG